MNNLNSLKASSVSRLLVAGLIILATSSSAKASSISFSTDPFEGFPVRNTPGRQVVGGEFFIGFATGTEQFVFDGPAFGLNHLTFFNGSSSLIPNDANVVVLETTDNDQNPLTPFGAGNAADLLAAKITVAGPGLFVYFNSSLSLARLVYSDDLSSSSADLRILARMLTLNGQQGLRELGELPNISAANFAIREVEVSAVPEPATLPMMGGAIALLAIGRFLRRSLGRHPASCVGGRGVATPAALMERGFPLAKHMVRPLALASLIACCSTSAVQAQDARESRTSHNEVESFRLADHQHDEHSAPSTSKLVGMVRDVTKQFLDVNAVASAGYAPLFGCVSGPDHGAMGIHYINLHLVGDGLIDVRYPEAIIYEPTPNGMRLVGVEYIVDAATWLKNHPAPPMLEGQAFQLVGSPNRFGLDPFFELHVWAWRTNSNGAYVDWNNGVSCEGQ